MRRCHVIVRRFSASAAPNPHHRQSHDHQMSAWQLHSYAPNLMDFALIDGVAVPTITSPSEVLIRVHAASLNPIDARMAEGYGHKYLNIWRELWACRRIPSEFPLTLGRDCSGTVLKTGMNVRSVRPGDQVYCAVGVERQGCFAEYVLAKESTVARKPKNLSHVEAASLPYVASTVWSALCTTARCNANNMNELKVLIHGGSGGIGTFALQLMKAWGAEVTVTCRSDAFDLVRKLGADNVVDYSTPEAFTKLTDHAPYDVILDPVGSTLSRESSSLLGLWRNSTFVSLVSPLLSDGDQYGFPFGFIPSGAKLAREISKELLSGGRLYGWAFFQPNLAALRTVTDLVEKEKIIPVVQKSVPFIDVDKALMDVGEMHGRGKTVVEVIHD